MKTLFTRLFPILAILLGAAKTAQAQYIFKAVPDISAGSNGLAPYQQNFDVLAGTNAPFINNQTIKGVYASFTLDGAGSYEYPSTSRIAYSATNIPYLVFDKALPPDDGSKGTTVNPDGTPGGAGWYHFGSATVNTTDRALGGIAATTTDKGVGYIGIRFRNSSGTLIKNLDISYAMEQWYNSGKKDKAQVKVAYRKLASNATETEKSAVVSGRWTDVSGLGIDAPSTAAAVRSSDGNSTTNRRVAHAKLIGGSGGDFGAGLADGEEIMIRWSYVFNSDTNGNGLSLDDVTVTPETNIFYSATGGHLNNINTWGINQDGSGTRPDFSSANTTYYVRGTDQVDRMPNNRWTISGVNSKVVVGLPSEPADLYVGSTSEITAPVGVTSGSALHIQNLAGTIKLGLLGSTSLVEYINTGTSTQIVSGGSYGILKLTGSGPKKLGSHAVVSTKVIFNNADLAATQLNALTLDNNDLTVLKGGIIDIPVGVEGMFVTNAKGGLWQVVDQLGATVKFPVAVSADVNDYTPVLLSQTAERSEDNYKVRVANGVYRKYDANENGSEPVTVGVVKKTWFVSEEVPGYSDITLQAFWNNKDEATGFIASNSFIDHYTTGAGWDGIKDAPSLVTDGKKKGTKKGGIKKFSPFGVTSQNGGVLPVQLVSFKAARLNTSVKCSWETASELNNDHFIVERSADGKQFTALGTVAGLGTSATGRAYTFVDSKALPGTSYYRLQQQDTDGTSSYSPVVAVASGSGQAEVTVVPNPGTGNFQVLGLPAETTQTGVVRSILGTQVQTVAPDGTFDLSTQPAGVYLLQLQTANGIQTKRIVKQ